MVQQLGTNRHGLGLAEKGTQGITDRNVVFNQIRVTRQSNPGLFVGLVQETPISTLVLLEWKSIPGLSGRVPSGNAVLYLFGV